MTDFFISSDNFNDDILYKTLFNNKIASNITLQISTVYNKKQDKYIKEHGAKVQIFDIDKNNLFKLYNDLIKNMNINCLWIDDGNFHNCITKMSGYKNYCKKNNFPIKKCSMY